MTMLTKPISDYEPPYGLYKYGSIDSIDSVLDEEFHDAQVTPASEDLDNLSNCLSEASKVSSDQEEQKSLLTDLYVTQISFWSLVGSLVYSYFWLQHRKKFVMTSFFMIPFVLSVCATIAALLFWIVILTQPDSIRRRLGSTSSTASQYDRSLSCEELPRPLCRKHSTSSSTSINLIGTGSVSPNGNGRRSPSTNSRKLSYSFTHQAAEE